MPQGMIRVMVNTDNPAIAIQTLYRKSLKRSTAFFMEAHPCGGERAGARHRGVIGQAY